MPDPSAKTALSSVASPGQPSGQASGQSSGQASGQSSGQASGQSPGQHSSEHSGQPQSPSGTHGFRLIPEHFFNSIKGKIFLVFVATFSSAFILMLINLWNLDTVKTRLLLGEGYYDLMNNILEARRYEKNFLIYRDTANLDEGLTYLKRIDGLVADLSSDIVDVSDARTFLLFQDSLAAYRRSLADAKTDPRPDMDRIRAQGKVLVDQADRLLETKKRRIHRSLTHSSVLPFAFLGVFGLLMILVIKLISKGMLLPLEVVRGTTARVARGDFSPIAYEGTHIEEISGLISAFNSMARELETKQEDLLQARKIAALGTFTAGIAHELNNPINNISLTAETFMEIYGDTLEDDEAREMLQDILSQSDRARDIVRNLLDFSRTERPDFNSLDPAEIARSTAALVKNQIMLAGIRFENLVPEGLPQVQGNLRNLQQVFMNLLLNAMQATPAGGAVSIAAEAEPGFVRLEVRDTGQGIPPETLEHIFEPFFTTKEVGRGTGLGLAVTYSIVRRHGGRIEVHSEPGQGSVFSVYLPRVTAGPRPVAD